MTWFASILLEEAEARDWSQKQLAAYLGKTPQTVSRWVRGGMPPPDEQEKVVMDLGGDLRRARPAWKPSESPISESAPEAISAGEIVGREARVSWLPEKKRLASALSVAGSIDPERWALGEGPALLLRLSEELGLWPAGSTVVARAWREGARPPAGLWTGAARCDAWGPGASGWRLRRLQLVPGARDAAPSYYAATSLDPLDASADSIPAEALELGAIACGVIMPV